MPITSGRADSEVERGETNLRTDLRTIDPHYSYREVYRLLDCEPSIEPDSVSSEPVEAPVRQALKQLGRTSS